MDALQVLTMTPMELVNKNLYVYCNENPVTFVDIDGFFPWLTAVIGAGMGAAAAIFSLGIQAGEEGGTVSAQEIIRTASVGAASGFIVGALIGVAPIALADSATYAAVGSLLAGIGSGILYDGTPYDKLRHGAMVFGVSFGMGIATCGYSPAPIPEIAQVSAALDNALINMVESVAADRIVQHIYKNDRKYHEPTIRARSVLTKRDADRIKSASVSGFQRGIISYLSRRMTGGGKAVMMCR